MGITVSGTVEESNYHYDLLLCFLGSLSQICLLALSCSSSSLPDDLSNLSLDPPLASTAQNTVASSNGGVLEPRNDVMNCSLNKLRARRAIRTLKGIIRLQAVIRGHLVRRQAVATYSCIWGIVKLQALVRGRIARSSSSSSSHNGIHCHKPNLDVNASEALQVSMYSWIDNPTKFIIVNKLLASSPAALPLKIQYGPDEPNSAEVWLERWTQLHVWSPPPRAAKILVPKPKTKKRNYQAVVDSEKARPKQGVKKQSGPTSGKVSNRSTTESGKLKRSVRKASTVSKDPLRTESDKAKQSQEKVEAPQRRRLKKPRPSLKSQVKDECRHCTQNDDGRTHSGRKVPSYMAPTASTLRHSLPSPANGKPGTTTTTTTMSPRAHKLLLASAKGSMNGDKSASSSKNKTEKSNKTDWKR
ncbi:hypothetical protein Bca52824_062809 [Brassica carinata]|uniref:DUF4005 domain-containing protein n=1 Tax=Brassica carinata TaxID=52824 RepID=A0A8X7QIP0_BRACI|nr:hypothetical protein Bca52824_062809 [Brassica carinata]